MFEPPSSSNKLHTLDHVHHHRTWNDLVEHVEDGYQGGNMPERFQDIRRGNIPENGGTGAFPSLSGVGRLDWGSWRPSRLIGG